MIPKSEAVHCVKSVEIRSFFRSVKYGPEKLRLWTLFAQWSLSVILQSNLLWNVYLIKSWQNINKFMFCKSIDWFLYDGNDGI